MAPRVLDTNIVSYLVKEHPLAPHYRSHLQGHTLLISFMTLAELYEGAVRAHWGRARRDTLERMIRGCVVIPSSTELCQRWARVRYERRRRPISGEDAWIAATALEEGCPLVTHDAADFRDITGLKVITVPE